MSSAELAAFVAAQREARAQAVEAQKAKAEKKARAESKKKTKKLTVSALARELGLAKQTILNHIEGVVKDVNKDQK